MANLEVEGRLIQKLSVASGTSARGAWEKQEFILEIAEGSFPTKIAFSVWGADKVKELANYAEGTDLRIAFNISSREFNGKWYTDLRAWRITPLSSSVPPPPAPVAYSTNVDNSVPAGFGPSVPPPTMDDFTSSNDEGDDLPF